MRIPQLAALFTTLLITRGGCMPSGSSYDLAVNDEEYNDNPSDAGEDPNAPIIPSHIYTKPLKLEVDIGSEVTLPCNVSNPENIVVLWKKGTLQLYSDDLSYITNIEDKRRIVRGRNNSLIIRDFKPSDVSNEYICEISTEPVERILHSVQMKKSVSIEPRDNIEVYNSDQVVNIRCNANWNPKPNIRWSHKGKSLKSDASPSDGSSLTITGLTASDAGFYQCLAEVGGNGDPIVKAINVKVHHAPIVRVADKLVHTGLHIETELSCNVSAYPQAVVTWYKNNVAVAVGRISRNDDKHGLVLSRVEREDFGIYICEAKNSMGKAEGTVELTGVPEAARFIKGNTNADGTVPTLEWEVKSWSPIIEYKLKYRQEGNVEWHTESPRATDDGIVGNTFRIKYPMENLKAGKYEALLMSRNEFGWSPEPSKLFKFSGENIIDEPEIASESKSGVESTKSFTFSRSFILAASFLVYTSSTCL